MRAPLLTLVACFSPDDFAEARGRVEDEPNRMDLPQPAMFANWDPLLQRRVVRAPIDTCPPTPMATTEATPIMGRLSMDTPEVPAGKASSMLLATLPAAVPASAHLASEAPTPGAPAAIGTPSTPAELEAQSLALAYRLQQEEHAAFIQAVRVSQSPAPRASTAAPADVSSELPTPGGLDDTSAQGMEVTGDGGDDESLRLAIQLQEEELRWQQAQSQHAGMEAAGDDDDEDLRLARLLQAEEDGEGP